MQEPFALATANIAAANILSWSTTCAAGAPVMFVGQEPTQYPHARPLGSRQEATLSDNIETPYGPVASKIIDEAIFPWNLLADTTGADAMGVAEENPAPFTLLGRLKTIGDLLAQLVELQGGAGGGSSGASLDFSQPNNSQYLGG